MSTSLFGTRQFKSSRNLKKLAISSPINTRASTDPLLPTARFSPISRKPVIVLKVCYDFVAESPVELTVRRNDYVKLLHRPGNGWLYVEFVDRAGNGLIPASYTEIIANDKENPISLEWLQQARPAKSPSPSASSPGSIRDIRVSTVLQTSKQRYLYRMDITMSSGKRAFLCKYYQEFYTLHSALKAALGNKMLLPSPPKERNLLDRSISTAPPSKDEIKVLLSVASDLGRYLRALLRLEQVRACEVFTDFIEDEQRKRVEVEPGMSAPTNSRINSLLQKDSVNILEGLLIDDFDLKGSPNSSQNTTENSNIPVALIRSNKKPLRMSPSKIALMPAFMAGMEYTKAQANPEPETRPLAETKKSLSESKNSLAESKNSLGESKSSIAESKSSQTLSTFSLLLAGYGEEEVLTETKSEDTLNSVTVDADNSRILEESQPSTVDTERLQPSKGPMKPPSPDISHESVSTIGKNDHAITHYSSGDDSLMLNSSRGRRLSLEPTTPTLTSEHIFADLPRKPFTDDLEEEIKPLLPRKHAMGDVSNSSSCATITQEKDTFSQPGSEFVKVKVTLCNEEDDKVLLRVRRSDLHSMRALKQKLLFKIYKDPGLIFHYKLKPFDEVDSLACPDDTAILNYVKNNRKAHLRLQRVR